MTYFAIWVHSSKSNVYFILYRASQFGQAVFQVRNSHMKMVATILFSTVLDVKAFICIESFNYC